MYLCWFCKQHGEFLYTTDWHTGSIERYDKKTGRGKQVILEGITGMMEIRVIAPDTQKGKHK